jgi:hypothetical protein
VSLLRQSRLCNRNTSINFMHDIKVTARVGVLAAIGNACKRPFDGLLIMKWWRLKTILGSRGTVVRIGPEVGLADLEKWRTSDNLL